MRETDCKTCAFCRLRINEKDEITLFSCNEAGMMTTDEALLPKSCERWREGENIKNYVMAAGSPYPVEIRVTTPKHVRIVRAEREKKEE